LCACGCGKQAKEAWDGDRFKGYRKYAEGCNGQKHSWTEDRKRKQSKEFSGLGHPKALPIGTIRKRTPQPGKPQYMEIKVNETGRWMLYHRYVAEQMLGRKLKKGECVHHKNGDGLDNREENLEVMSHGSHATLTGERIAANGQGIWAVPVCPVCGWRHPPH
jgi:hypothetical protein